MKTEDEILSKITQMKLDLDDYINHYNQTMTLKSNGIPNEIEKDPIYNISRSQIEALEWVLKDSRRK